MTPAVTVSGIVEDPLTEPIGRWHVFFYGVGHMLNDITASCWFTHPLLLLTRIGLSPAYGVGYVGGEILQGTVKCKWLYRYVLPFGVLQWRATEMSINEVAELEKQ